MIVLIKEYTVVAGVGAVIYSLVEIIYRGHTHWTMTVTGGAVFLMLYILNTRVEIQSLALRCLIGCVAITLIELAVGCIVNRKLGWNVWDYSGMRFNLLGQICPAFSLAWYALCFPAYWLSMFLQSRLS